MSYTPCGQQHDLGREIQYPDHCYDISLGLQQFCGLTGDYTTLTDDQFQQAIGITNEKISNLPVPVYLDARPSYGRPEGWTIEDGKYIWTIEQGTIKHENVCTLHTRFVPIAGKSGGEWLHLLLFGMVYILLGVLLLYAAGWLAKLLFVTPYLIVRNAWQKIMRKARSLSSP